MRKCRLCKFVLWIARNKPQNSAWVYCIYKYIFRTFIVTITYLLGSYCHASIKFIAFIDYQSKKTTTKNQTTWKHINFVRMWTMRFVWRFQYWFGTHLTRITKTQPKMPLKSNVIWLYQKYFAISLTTQIFVMQFLPTRTRKKSRFTINFDSNCIYSLGRSLLLLIYFDASSMDEIFFSCKYIRVYFSSS